MATELHLGWELFVTLILSLDKIKDIFPLDAEIEEYSCSYGSRADKLTSEVTMRPMQEDGLQRGLSPFWLQTGHFIWCMCSWQTLDEGSSLPRDPLLCPQAHPMSESASRYSMSKCSMSECHHAQLASGQRWISPLFIGKGSHSWNSSTIESTCDTRALQLPVDSWKTLWSESAMSVKWLYLGNI